LGPSNNTGHRKTGTEPEEVKKEPMVTAGECKSSSGGKQVQKKTEYKHNSPFSFFITQSRELVTKQRRRTEPGELMS
jgi:hypothetical protein